MLYYVQFGEHGLKPQGVRLSDAARLTGQKIYYFFYKGEENMKRRFTKALASVLAACSLATATQVALTANAYSYPGDANVWATSHIYSAVHYNGKRNVALSYSSSQGTYWMVDKNRKIRIVEDGVYQPGYHGNPNVWYIATGSTDPVAFTDWTTFNARAQLMENMENARDYYSSLGHSNFNFDNGTGVYTYLYGAHYNVPGSYATNCNYGQTWIGFGEANSMFYNMSVDDGIVKMPFAELILKQKVGWYGGMGLEAGAIRRAYVDLFAELGEESTDWKIGAKAYKANYSTTNPKNYSMVNIASPSQTTDPSISVSGFYTTVSAFNNNKTTLQNLYNQTSGNGRYNAVRRASTVLSNALYKSTTGSNALTKNDLAKILYKSLDSYGNNATWVQFNNIRGIITGAASNYLYSTYNSTTAANKLSRLNTVLNQAGL